MLSRERRFGFSVNRWTRRTIKIAIGTQKFTSSRIKVTVIVSGQFKDHHSGLFGLAKGISELYKLHYGVSQLFYDVFCLSQVFLDRFHDCIEGERLHG